MKSLKEQLINENEHLSKTELTDITNVFEFISKYLNLSKETIPAEDCNILKNIIKKYNIAFKLSNTALDFYKKYGLI